jgi:hypothetical protein
MLQHGPLSEPGTGKAEKVQNSQLKLALQHSVSERGARKLMGENLKVVRAEFLTLSSAVSQNVYNCMAYSNTAESRVENSAQVSYCKLKFARTLRQAPGF